MKLIQLKPFNAETITPDIAAKIMALVGLQKMFDSEAWKKDGFTITNECTYHVYDANGKLHHIQNFNRLNGFFGNGGFTIKEISYGVTVICNYLPNYKLRIWENGRAIQYHFVKKGDWISGYSGNKEKGIPPSNEYAKENKSSYEYPCDQVELIQLYLDLGFYTIEQ